MDIVRPIMFLPGTKGVLPALTEMRSKRQQIAIVLDEYGGTDGIVTLEDLVETLIGDIHDEYDDLSEEVSNTLKSGVYEVDGLIALEDLAEQTGVEIPEGPYETLSVLRYARTWSNSRYRRFLGTAGGANQSEFHGRQACRNVTSYYHFSPQ